MAPPRETHPTMEVRSEPPAKATDPNATARGVDLLAMTEGEHVSHLSGYLSGVLAGIDMGREQMDAELGELQRRAFGVVQAMAKLPPWDQAQQARRQHQEKAAGHHRAAGQPWPLEVAS